MKLSFSTKLPFLFPLFLFFPLCPAFGEGAEPVLVRELLKTSASWDGRPLPDYPRGRPEVTIARITIPPGATFPLHKHPMINAGVLMSGELSVTTEENKTIHIRAGEALAEVVDQWHYGKNEGKVPAEILVFYAGTVGSPTTLKK